MDDSKMIDWLRDREEIRQLMIAYGRAADCGNGDERARRLREILTPDAVIEYSFGVVEGREEIIATLNKMMGTFDYTHHLVSNDEIKIDGDNATGHYLLTAVHGPKDGPMFWAGARYTEQLVRTIEGWRIQRHQSRSLWNSKV